MLTNKTSREIALYIFGIISVLIFGTAGYFLIEGWSVLDSLYMTVITLSTVGFMEVNGLSDYGRIFTIILIFMGVGVSMALLTTLAKLIISHQMHWIFERRDMKQAIQDLNNHIIFCGFSRLGRTAIAELKAKGQDLVVIELDLEKAKQAELEGLLVIQGDASKDDILLKAGIKKAAKIASILPKDSDNLYVVLTAKELKSDVYIISKAEDELGEKRLKRAGANKIISPYRVGGQRIADGLLRPYVTDFLDLTSFDSKSDLFLEEILVPEKSFVVGQAIRDTGIREETNIIIAAIISADSKMQYNPSGNTIIKAKDNLICLGEKNAFKKMGEILLKKA